MTHAVVDLSVAAVLIVVSIVLLVGGSRAGVYTCLLGTVALIGGSFALFVYRSAQAQDAASSLESAASEDAESGS